MEKNIYNEKVQENSIMYLPKIYVENHSIKDIDILKKPWT